MSATRAYQENFSSLGTAMFDQQSRTRKARTMVAVLNEFFPDGIASKKLLNVGGSAGFIDTFLAGRVQHVTSIDIDRNAIEFAIENNQNENVDIRLGDAMNLEFADASFDVVICSQVYEHVPSADTMMEEIFRTLRPGGVCYFAAGNRLMWNEPHYGLPLLSVIPRPMAHRYLRLMNKGSHYYEKHLGLWGLKKLTSRFLCHDYTRKIIEEPKRYRAEYMIPPESGKQKIARGIARYAYWAVPGYIWLLEKPRRVEETA